MPNQTYPATTPSAANTAVDAPIERWLGSSNNVLRCFPAELELSTLDGTNGFALNGTFSDYPAGSHVSEAGDVNGDGIDDILIGAISYYGFPDSNDLGQSYVVFGQQSVVDSDGDGVPDDLDQCEMSDLRPTVVLNGCDSGVFNALLGEPAGCTIIDVIESFGEDAKNHGKFVSASAHFLEELMQVGDLAGVEKDAVQSCVGRSRIP